MICGFNVLQTSKLHRYLALRSKLPFGILRKWKGIEARGACKITWANRIDLFHINSYTTRFLLRNGSEKVFNEILNGSEIIFKSGLKLVEVMKCFGANSKRKSRSKKNPILFFNPNGYSALLKKISGSPADQNCILFLKIEKLSNTKTIPVEKSGKKELYRFVKITFDKLKYEEVKYLEC